MSRFAVLLLVSALSVSVCFGGIQIIDPLSGALPAGPQQPAGSATNLQQTDTVSVNYWYYGPGFYNSGNRQCEETWAEEFDNDDWWAESEIYFSSSSTGGYWTVGANLWRDDTVIASDTEGGSMTPL